MASAAQINLIKTLASKTKTGQVMWTTSGDNESFTASFSRGSVKISISPNEDRAEDYLLQIYNEKGQRVEAIWDFGVSDDLSNAYDLMRDIYQGARSKALGIDKVVEDILEDLNLDDEIPF